MLAAQNLFSVRQTVTVFACCSTIKKSLSICEAKQNLSGIQRIQQQKQLNFKISKSISQCKMEYLRYVYNRVLGYGCENGTITPRKVLAFGNVLLDTTVHLTDTSVLEKFNLTPDSKGELEAETIAQITAEACANNECKKNPGGSALNTSRIMAKLGTEPTFFGAIGEDDDAGEELKRLISSQLADVRLQSVHDVPTGQCIALIHDDSASHYANIGASANFSIEYLKTQEKRPFLRPIERKQIIYIEGFFIPHREHVCDYIVQNYVHDRHRLAINLSSDYIVKENSEQITKLAHNALFIFGNQIEFDALMNVMNVKTEMDLAQELTKQGRNVKIIIITKGEKGLTVISNYVDEFDDPGNLTVESFNAQRVETVIDPTGAGDAFVASFLHNWLQKRQLSECVRLAADIASKVVTQIGCQMPEE